MSAVAEVDQVATLLAKAADCLETALMHLDDVHRDHLSDPMGDTVGFDNVARLLGMTTAVRYWAGVTVEEADKVQRAMIDCYHVEEQDQEDICGSLKDGGGATGAD